MTMLLARFDTADDEENSWASQLHESNRPKELIALLLGLVRGISTAARRVAADVAISDSRGGLGAAIGAEHAITAALAVFEAHADDAIANAVPQVLSQLRTHVEDVAGADLARHTAIADQLQAELGQYITANVREVRRQAQDAVNEWYNADSNDLDALRTAVAAALAGLGWRAERIVRTATQDSYIAMLRDGFSEAKTAMVRREAMPSGCDWCKAVAGVYPADSPDLYDTHPHCACVWSPAPATAVADFSAPVRGPEYLLEAV